MEEEHQLDFLGLVSCETNKGGREKVLARVKLFTLSRDASSYHQLNFELMVYTGIHLRGHHLFIRRCISELNFCIIEMSLQFSL